jgi:hypothetical protein
MTIGYSEYVSKELDLIMYSTKKRVEHPLYKIIYGEDILYRVMVLKTIQRLKTKEFLIYFMKNQLRLVEEQKLNYKELKLEYFRV